jgi:hypothetical protein
LIRHWPNASNEWSTKSVQDAFYASPVFPRLLKPSSLKHTIAEGVMEGIFGIATKGRAGRHENTIFHQSLKEDDIEISEVLFLVKKEVVEEDKRKDHEILAIDPKTAEDSNLGISLDTSAKDTVNFETATIANWEAEVPPEKYNLLYVDVLSKFNASWISINMRIKIQSEHGISKHVLQEAKEELKNMGLSDMIH